MSSCRYSDILSCWYFCWSCLGTPTGRIRKNEKKYIFSCRNVFVTSKVFWWSEHNHFKSTGCSRRTFIAMWCFNDSISPSLVFGLQSAAGLPLLFIGKFSVKYAASQEIKAFCSLLSSMVKTIIEKCRSMESWVTVQRPEHLAVSKSVIKSSSCRSSAEPNGRPSVRGDDDNQQCSRFSQQPTHRLNYCSTTPRAFQKQENIANFVNNAINLKTDSPLLLKKTWF